MMTVEDVKEIILTLSQHLDDVSKERDEFRDECNKHEAAQKRIADDAILAHQNATEYKLKADKLEAERDQAREDLEDAERDVSRVTIERNQARAECERLRDGQPAFCNCVPQRIDHLHKAIDQIRTQRDRLVEALNRFLLSSPCQNGCDPNDMTCDTSFARVVIRKIETQTEPTPQPCERCRELQELLTRWDDITEQLRDDDYGESWSQSKELRQLIHDTEKTRDALDEIETESGDAPNQTKTSDE